ncbi:MAG: Coenzyme F420 hydrogenase/dehydrogenase, beta subunit C-terminal domain, partial [Herbinix sp.]|nr:Coenzyme F420 hydrogenase/dehydrogenase, beta subunit C-terminal domain [Herbinix sp.]
RSSDLQSDMGDIFTSIKRDLAAGKHVLFTGTPCQAAGLRGFLEGKDDTNLILCDLVCHGVPSPSLWQEYKLFMERKRKFPLKMHYFRAKDYGWHGMCVRNVFQNGKEDKSSILSQIHMNLFLSELILRPCCYHCKFCSFRRCSDITIADFWGIENSLPEFDDNKGISLVLTNTLKGSDLFHEINDKLEVRESNSGDCLQRNLQTPTPLPPGREQFWKEYFDYGYGYVAKKYAGYTLYNRTKQTIITLLKATKIFLIIKRSINNKLRRG